MKLAEKDGRARFEAHARLTRVTAITAITAITGLSIAEVEARLLASVVPWRCE